MTKTTATLDATTLARIKKHGISGQSVDFIINRLIDIVEKKK